MLYGPHDGRITSYEVRCAAREIELKVKLEGPGTATVLFIGVVGYDLRRDDFGNIIADIEEVSVATILDDHSAEIAEAYRISGAYGPWAGDMATAEANLNAMNIKGYILSCSIGLGGWILAQDITVKRMDAD